MIVVTMTSWSKRIKNVLPIICNIFRGVIKPDRLYLNLSIQEFPHMEKELPQDLVEYCSLNGSVIINWVEGENTKTMKKVFPILKYLDDDDIIITCDDDILINPYLIKSRINDIRKYNYRYAISSSSMWKFINNSYTLSATSIYTKRMFNNWEKLYTDEVVKTYNDDMLYTYILWLNGVCVLPCTKYDVWHQKNFNGVEGAFETSLFLMSEEFDKVILPVIKSITGTDDIKKCFGYFKYDCNSYDILG